MIPMFRRCSDNDFLIDFDRYVGKSFGDLFEKLVYSIFKDMLGGRIDNWTRVDPGRILSPIH